MNKEVSKARDDINKVDALMFAIENTYLDYTVAPEEKKRYNRGAEVFYLLWDAIQQVSDDIESLEKIARKIRLQNEESSRTYHMCTLKKKD